MNFVALMVSFLFLHPSHAAKDEPVDQQHQQQGQSSVVAPLAAPTPILTSLLLAALATANPTLTNTLLLTNPYLTTYFLPHLPFRYPIYGYSAANIIQDSSAFGSPYKRESRQ